MTSMWMVQNDDGSYLRDDGDLGTGAVITFNDLATAKSAKNLHGGHLVEMVPAKPKVPVSRKEAKLIDDARSDSYPATCIARESDFRSEDRLIRAYVNGYTVVEPTKYNVKVPHMQTLVYCRDGEGGLVVTDVDTINGAKFTLEQIKAYKLQDCERVEINTEDSENE